MFNYAEIDQYTGFAQGEEFTSEEEVRAYFTMENMRSMFQESPADITQEDLDQMADTVVNHAWNCAF